MEILGKIMVFLLGLVTVFVTVVGTILLFGLLFAIPTMLLWDWLMPELFGLGEITLFQAWGMNMLSGILFKSKSMSKDVKKKGKKKTVNRKINLHD